MSKTKKLALSLSIATLTIGLLTMSAFAYTGPPDQEQRLERMESMHMTFENNDYDAWAELVAEGPRGEDLLEKINEDNFERFAEANMLMFEAKEILDELGLDHPGLDHPGKMQHKGRMMNSERL